MRTKSLFTLVIAMAVVVMPSQAKKNSVKECVTMQGVYDPSTRPLLSEDVNVIHSDSNPLAEALQPIPQTAVFGMEGYNIWCPSVIKVDDTYHLFCSRWEKDGEWFDSEVIHSTSKSLFGPYEFQRVVLDQNSYDKPVRGIHNPKIIKVGDQYMIYHIVIPGHPGYFNTGIAYADDINGEWKSANKIIAPANNPAICMEEDGSIYMLSKFKRNVDGTTIVGMRGHRASDIMGPYTTVKDDGNRLPDELELEDPDVTIQRGKYHVICTDWSARATGVKNGLTYFVSDDGENFDLYSQIPVLDKTKPIPLEGGGELNVRRTERPFIYLNEKGDFEALLSSAHPTDESESFIMIIPVDKFKFK